MVEIIMVEWTKIKRRWIIWTSVGAYLLLTIASLVIKMPVHTPSSLIYSAFGQSGWVVCAVIIGLLATEERSWGIDRLYVASASTRLSFFLGKVTLLVFFSAGIALAGLATSLIVSDTEDWTVLWRGAAGLALVCYLSGGIALAIGVHMKSVMATAIILAVLVLVQGPAIVSAGHSQGILLHVVDYLPLRLMSILLSARASAGTFADWIPNCLFAMVEATIALVLSCLAYRKRDL